MGDKNARDPPPKWAIKGIVRESSPDPLLVLLAKDAGSSSMGSSSINACTPRTRPALGAASPRPGRRAPRALRALLGAAILTRSASGAKLISAKNAYKSDFGGLVDSSMLKVTTVAYGRDALTCASLPLPLTYRVGSHVSSDFARADDGSRVAFFRDDGEAATVDVRAGVYESTAPAADPAGTEAVVGSDGAEFLTLRRGALARASYGNATETAATCAPPAGADPTDGVGSWFGAFGNGVVVLAKNRYAGATIDYLAAPSTTGGTCGTAKPRVALGANASFCGMAFDAATGHVYALVETHDTSKFPDPDCENLSGLVTSNTVVRVASDGTMEELADVPGGGAMVGSPAMWDAAERTWLVVRGGGLYAFNATSRGWTAGESGACEDLGEHASVL